MLPHMFTDPLTWVIVIVVMIVSGVIADRAARKQTQEPSLAKIEVPKVSLIEDVRDGDPIRPHLFELIATAVNSGVIVKFWNMRDLRAGATVLGNWRITVEKIED